MLLLRMSCVTESCVTESTGADLFRGRLWRRARPGLGRALLVLVAVSGILTTASAGRAQLATFTTSESFFNALPGPPQTLDFDALAAGTLIPSGSTESGITFSYAFDGESLMVTDFFDTTSGSNSLGLTGGDEALLDGDRIALAFDVPVNALGIVFVTNLFVHPAGIEIVTPVGSAFTSGIREQRLADAGVVYFIGLVSTLPFDTASIEFEADIFVDFEYNVDDITTAVPEPAPHTLATSCLLALFALHRLRTRGHGARRERAPTRGKQA